MNFRYLLFGCFLIISMGHGNPEPSPIDIKKEEWIKNTYESMSEDERIGQLFMIRAFSKKENPKESEKVMNQIRKYHVGGICFFQGDPKQQAILTNRYQSISKIPLLVSIDGEWGLGMRFPDRSTSFPRQLMLGAIQDNNLIYEMGEEVAKQCKRIGLHINFAPVVDVNNNPKNPVINDRSFGENKYNVAAKGYAYMKGMEDNGLLACAKHFPGHGDTDVDSHKDLPVINHSKNRLDSLELMPFRSLAAQGISGMMVAHLNIPILDDRENRPTTLSDKVIKDLLRKELDFKGLIFTDAMEMKGVTKHFEDGIAEAEALKAGNDIIVLPNDLEKAIAAVKKYIKEGKITQAQIEASVKRQLDLKYRIGLTEAPVVENVEDIYKDVNSKSSIALKSKLIENALTLAKDEKDYLPLSTAAKNKVAVISIGSPKETAFQKRIKSYVPAKSLNTKREISSKEKQTILKETEGFDHIIIGIHNMSRYASKNFGITPGMLDLISTIENKNKMTLVVFGNPYALKYFDTQKCVLLAYDNDPLVQDIAAQSVYGANAIKGKLPVTASEVYPYGSGIVKEVGGTLGYSIPERVGLDSERLTAIDTIIAEMIDTKAAPGCQVLIAKDGKIVLEKSYGHFTYDKKRAVTNSDVYDVASVTKIMTSTISLMKLQDEGKFDLKAKLSRYIPEAKKTNKGNLVMEDMLAHQARLKGWIPFYTSTVTGDTNNPLPKKEYYSRTLLPSFTVPVAKRMFLRSDYVDSMWTFIFDSELRNRDDYRYSDLAFYMMHRSIRNITGTPLNEYVDSVFYRPLGLKRIGYQPLQRLRMGNIVPSEKDNYFRKQVVQGSVHDMGAAMLGGVSGHAGLFSNAGDLAVLAQMLLNGGHYGGNQYLDPATIKRYTTRYYRSTRRGIGFDMKEIDTLKPLNMSELASDSTFGHLGFTGTAVFADPEHNLVYIFLSNRTYPTMKNKKFADNEYRPRVQSVIYEAMKSKP